MSSAFSRMAFSGSASRSTEDVIASLHHVFGDNDLIVARRQLREATGDASLRWAEIVEKLEVRRAWT